VSEENGTSQQLKIIYSEDLISSKISKTIFDLCSIGFICLLLFGVDNYIFISYFNLINYGDNFEYKYHIASIYKNALLL